MGPVVCITGMMRSGTSMVAQVVHRLGFPVSSFIPAPAPPSWRSDWEDPRLTWRLMAGKKVNWRSYVIDRDTSSRILGFGGRVAIKSPYLALRHREIARQIDPLWVVINRDRTPQAISMLAHPQLSLADQTRIDGALYEFEPAYCIQYEEMLDDPVRETQLLAEAIGADLDNVEAAAALIGSPTEYPCLQSSPQ